jgi:hypothetical protein
MAGNCRAQHQRNSSSRLQGKDTIAQSALAQSDDPPLHLFA